jgi:hypothetical protein
LLLASSGIHVRADNRQPSGIVMPISGVSLIVLRFDMPVHLSVVDDETNSHTGNYFYDC